MQFPYKIIESRYSSRSEFHITDGFQPTYALFYLRKGSFAIEIDGIKEQINTGDCIILPDYIHFRRNVLHPIEFVYVKFACNPNCPYSIDIPYGKVSFKDTERFFSNISALERLITYDDSLSGAYREHLLIDILFQIYSEQNPIAEPPEKKLCRDAFVAAAISYIDENIGKKISIEDICHAASTNASTLNFKFRREFNMSVGQFIIKRRMEKARQLLAGTTYSLSEIALRCGFDNVYYFSNAFKKYNGVSPSSYRK